jgi:hypothetical protein
LEEKQMAFAGTRQDVANVVLEVIRAIQNDNSIVEGSAFGQDIIVDKLARRNYASPIVKLMGERFPVLTKFGPDDCENASKVKDIVDAVWDDLKS